MADTMLNIQGPCPQGVHMSIGVQKRKYYIYLDKCGSRYFIYALKDAML
jgi:hypothetical protein